ncbi:MAG TPA: hypothetical protein VEH76_12790 [Methylocystis sp.]|nr:hypothetical protein [Methylocystis sp.]
MRALRASYTIEPEVLQKFNEMVPSGERSRVIQKLMQEALSERERQLEAIAKEFESHPDFAQARADCEAFDATVADGLDR